MLVLLLHIIFIVCHIINVVRTQDNVELPKKTPIVSSSNSSFTHPSRTIEEKPAFLNMEAVNEKSALTDNIRPQKMDKLNKRDRSASTDEIQAQAGKIDELKKREAELSRLLTQVRREKVVALRSRPLTIGIIGFGRFGQFMAKTFNEHGTVVATSRSDYSSIAEPMGVSYVPLSDPASFIGMGLDVIVLACSIVSFEGTVKNLAPHLRDWIDNEDGGNGRGPLIVDVLSVKEHPRQIMIDILPKECDIMCAHPMFGPDSGGESWKDLNFVFERTRIDGAIMDQQHETDPSADNKRIRSSLLKASRGVSTVHLLEDETDSHIEGVDRMERFLSIWEEEGCNMVELSCKDHDYYAASSQFLTHLTGRILGEQGLVPTPIDTKGFENVLNLVKSTTDDSFDLFFGLYKFNTNSRNTIIKMQKSMEGVVQQLEKMEKESEGV